ncbi:thioredoxin-like associated protein 2, putative [Plasmodium knowlesi strain H]|uniref:Thioredoxin-like associated protein 2, putative n=3 Tax=Plasmodium knowlesi TaxID=5850 RepID=A0A5K1UUG5_PLAKH|nr:thioredoxin-like associated protein 2, putative [Plasmodium knowlesi strain H]OTN68300.1 putative Thioredoxin-like associated protein 2 [Plasmodium knowlesi]CAA9987245.1 thioredoxin-like associated protein 2, putative [Plasmodium knowlesi strain H]SBO24017.1 thioredoxin-like associated protein 2, putative [Plasmodium knowlesi strain H]SBO26019.1 thioredoxin-like associated protein 2, putative [Plasmodium knowlesi strain H]VVS76719.1 thioredoxin-like associated protein 2, putative [Plasmodiu|eukprot:XP_002261867.1 hypothetical protein, conserved in Plasmodium species [Plasmodium knowlesi strain H]
MSGNQRTNNEYASPMVINVNNKQVNASPLSYKSYAQRSINLGPDNSQHESSVGDNMKNYVQYYGHRNGSEMEPLKHTTSQNISWGRVERQKTMGAMGLAKKWDSNRDDLNHIVTNNANSTRVPTNHTSEGSTQVRTFQKSSPEYVKEILPFEVDKSKRNSLPGERKTTPINVQSEMNNKNDLSFGGKEYRSVHPRKNQNDYLVEEKGEHPTKSIQVKKKKSVTISTGEKNTFLGDMKRGNNIAISKNFQSSGEEMFSTGQGHVSRNKADGKNGGVNNSKIGEEIKSDHLSTPRKWNNDHVLGRDTVQEYQRRNGKKEYTSPQCDGKGSQKDKSYTKASIHRNGREQLPHNLSINFKRDIFHMTKGLRIFEHMIIVDKNNVLRLWNGFEWKRVENYFEFVTTARYDHKGHLWCVNTSYELLKKMKKKFKNFGYLANEEIVDITFDKKNVLWCVNRKGELLKWNRSKWTKVIFSGFHKLISVAFDNRGDLWAINTKRALAIWCEKDGCWNEKVVKDGLKICAIDFDNDGHIWVVSTAGALLTYSQGHWVNFGYVCLDRLISVGFRKVRAR